MKIALAGNPNSGKTTLFNALTGSTQYVGNWPGVTVEKKDGKLKGHKDVTIQDLPGIYSLSPYTLEEVVTRRYLVNETPDAIINIIDGTNLERNLYLSTQLAELGIPMVLAVNMYDIIEKKGDKIDLDQLGKLMGCKAVTLSALKNKGTDEVVEEAIKLGHQHKTEEHPHVFVGSVEHALAHIEESIEGKVDASKLRWFAVKVFERDEKVLEELKLDQATLDEIEGHIADCEKEMDDDSESIITNQRYVYIKDSIGKVLTKKNPHQTLSTSDKIDKIVTNRFLALPIFALIMWFVYYISVSTIGGAATDWVNEVLFGDIIPPAVTAFLKGIGCAAPLISLIVDGIIAGVGTVLGFVPQMALIFLFLAILEDSGYMARIAFIMDRLLRKFGLSGKSFIPILIGTGCGVPAVMGTRTIENESDRRMTIMLCTFIPCGAKTVIIGMITSTFFPGNVWIAPAMYFLSILVIIFSGIALKKTKFFAGDPAPFVMELPPYHVPTVKGVLIHVWERAKAFMIKAGTIIFSICIVIWLLSTFNTSFQMVDIEKSMLASIGRFFAVLFQPVGIENWKGSVAVISALAAKEQAVSTISILNHLGDADSGAKAITAMASTFTAMGGFSFMILNLFDPPCVAAIGTIMREMGSKFWGWFAVLYQLVLGYVLAMITYQLGSWLVYGASFGLGQIISIVFIVVMIYFVVRPAPKAALKAQEA